MALYRVWLTGGERIDLEADRHKRLTYSDREGGEPGDLLFFSNEEVVRRYSKDDWDRYEELDDRQGPLDTDPSWEGFAGNEPQS